MQPRLPFVLVASLILGLLAGCATTTQTDADKVSGGDLLFGRERLQQFLAARRQVLSALQTRAGDLETQVMAQLGRLRQVEKEHAAASATSQAATATLRELQAQQKKAGSTLDRITQAQAEIKRAEAAAIQADKDAVERARQQQAALQQEVSRLEGEVALINDSIRRTLRLREEQMLRESSTKP
jgi:chromosome segregation ATPase